MSKGNLKQFRDPDFALSGNPIGFFEREFYVLSNFSSFQVDYHGRHWPTSEHAYQAEHFYETAPHLVEQIYKANSAHEAFKIAKANGHLAPKNWEEIKVGIMEKICQAKLEQNPYVKSKLLQTGDTDLMEDSPYDDCWGWGPNRDGRNELGKVWMRIREKLKG